MLRALAVVGFLGSILIGQASLAQTAAQPVTIPNRMVFRVVADNRVDTHRAHPGDKVKMRIAAEEILDNGVKIAADSLIEGHVVESTPHSGDSEARLAIILDRLRVHKTWVPLHAFIVAQGQFRRIDSVRIYSQCWGDDFRRDEIHPNPDCGGQPRRPIDALPITGESQVIQDVQLVDIGKPGTGTAMVSKKGDIVIEPGMAFLIRNVVLR